MLRYVLQRLLGAVPILLGVLLVTFLLFHAGAGDPAALMLGKNAAARDIEALRSQLRLDRPLLYGHWCRTELYPGQDFRQGAGAVDGQPGCTWRPDGRSGQGALELAPGAVCRLPRGWAPAEAARHRVRLEWQGALTVAGQTLESPGRWRRATLDLAATPAQLEVAAGAAGARLRELRIERRQDNPWDSQLTATLRELVDWRRDPGTGRGHWVFFDFGCSLQTGEPIRELLWDGLGPSLALTVPIFIIELILAVVIALISAYWRDSWLDRGLVTLSVALMSISYLVYILVGQYLLAYRWNLFPVWGWESWRNLLLPVLVGVVSGLGGSVRFYRTVFLNEMYRDHVRTARAKGCGPWRILLRHVLANALVPIITRVAVTLPFLYTGSLLLESFFGIPGLGFAGVNALANADLQLLKALVLAGSFLFVAANLLADLAYAWADPRIRLH
ncbi:MAG: ABC transporter permease [Lentisphaeria bacterium]